MNKPIAPSRNPSRVLILGEAPSTIARALKRAGHVVETADKIDEVKKREYQVVLVSDKEDMGKAESAWAAARVVAMKRGTSPNIELVENTLGRKAIDVKTDRAVVASGPDEDPERKRVKSGEGTDDDRPAINAAAEKPEVVATVQKPAVEEKPVEQPKPVEKAKPAEEKPVEEKPVVAEKPKAKPVEKPAPVVEEEEEEEAKPVLASRTAPRDEPSGELAKSARTLDEPKADKPAKRNGRKGAESVRFELASTRLNPSAKKQLDRHAAFLRSHESATIMIEGHTDEIGSEEINLVLSEERAQSARKYLLKKGIADSRITTQAFGETNPPYEPSSNPKNRCAFFKIQGAD